MEEDLLSLRAGAEAAEPLRLCWETHFPYRVTRKVMAMLLGLGELLGTEQALNEHMGKKAQWCILGMEKGKAGPAVLRGAPLRRPIGCSVEG